MPPSLLKPATAFSLPKFHQQVLTLLHRSHRPLVQVRPSHLPAAGQGVFTQQAVSAGQALCLYPGVYAAGLPFSQAVDADGEAGCYYLGQSTLPSGVPAFENAYILNLAAAASSCITSSSPVGGYLDGLALQDSSKKRRRLDENPSACAQFVNHSATRPNVHVVSIHWREFAKSMLSDESDDDSLFPFPNVPRSDQKPWYLNQQTQEMVFYDSNHLSSTCFGAVFCATTDLEEDQELHLDYGLQEPLPTWAEGWYYNDGVDDAE